MTNFLAGTSLDHMEARGAAVRSFSHLISGFAEGVVKRMREHRTRRELMDLDDRMLNDIGISRIDLRARRLSEITRGNWSGRGHPSRI